MLTGLYSAATAMDAAQKNHEVIARNLSHSGVAGYRGDVATFKSFSEAFKASLEEVSPQGHGVVIDSLHTNFLSGPLESSGRQLDLAIHGDGFFEIASDEGLRYTRNGVFFLSEDGVIVDSSGHALQGDGGEVRVSKPFTDSDVQIAVDGSISVGGNNIGKVKIVEFADRSQLVRSSTTSFRAPEGVEPTPSESSLIRQGVREQSNVSAIEQLVQMIINTRQHDAAKQSITKIDESIGRLTNPQA